MTKRDRIVLAVVGVAALLGAFWMLVLTPKREQASDLKQQVAKEEQRRDDALARVRVGEEARASFAEDYATVAKLGKAVPVGDQTPSLLYQLESAARANDVDLRAMKVRGGGTPAAPASSTSAPGSVPSATQAAAAVAPPGSVVGPAGFPTMPFTFRFEGDFFRMERLFSSIEKFTSTIPSGEDVDVRGRLVTVDGFALIRSRLFGFPRVTASVAATAYVLPPGEGAFDGATADAPASAGGTGQTASAPSGTKAPTATATAGGLTP
ncbi:MAG: type II secretion system protein M [Actinomycetota bacterium]|nr:type II secretion system protein M [Actinomycetota bacterium]